MSKNQFFVVLVLNSVFGLGALGLFAWWRWEAHDKYVKDAVFREYLQEQAEALSRESFGYDIPVGGDVSFP